jgi:hypothetical protein
VGFGNENIFHVKHDTRLQTFSYTQDYLPHLVTIKFSISSGITLYIDGYKIEEYPEFKEPVKDNIGSRIGILHSVKLGEQYEEFKMDIAEIKAYGKTLVDEQRIEQEIKLMQKYGL